MSIAYLGFGANLPSPAGSPEATMAAAVVRLGSIDRVVSCSSLYSTTPVGFADQPHFFNAVVALEAKLSPRELLEALLDIEREFGRDRSAGIANGPRTLDLDILLYGDFVLGQHGLAVPHPRLAERAFVLVPLNEIAPHVREPRSGATMQQLVERLSQEDASKNSLDGVVQVESDLWRAGARGTAAGSAVSQRTDSGADSAHS
jgi:2-amino-4-hydroxy-6-hydroxymethyldihydropteridine diphosphokinase